MFAATMAWVVGMADDESREGKASGGKKRKRQKESTCEMLFDIFQSGISRFGFMDL